MGFESLSFRYDITLDDFTERWLPLIHLYDPDLPLFPIYYFHVLPDDLDEGYRPTDIDRAFGYVEKINLYENKLIVSIVTNKDLDWASNQRFIGPVINEIRERFGINNPVASNDINNVFSGDLARSNNILVEMWQRVVANAYGNLLPFGRLWDEVFGLVRFVASWNSQGGRKGELIQSHYFVSKFGEKIQVAGNIPAVDYYLLPTIKEITDVNNPLNHFPKFSCLIEISKRFQNNYCETIDIGAGISLSKFVNPYSGSLNTEKILSILNGSNIPFSLRSFAFECFNSFGKGPQRTIIFLLMLYDLVNGRLSPGVLTSSQCGSIYDSLKRTSTYQSPKVIEIYSQQSFGNPSAMPIDTWISSFFFWPLCIFPVDRMRNKFEYIFTNSNNLGKVERLLWVTAQARKVHSSACNDSFWCLKIGSSKNNRDELNIKELARGANPLACNICLSSIRSCCPAYNEIKYQFVSFNTETTENFNIITSAHNNSTPGQTFVKCYGNSIYRDVLDVFSPADDPTGFAPYPDSSHNGGSISVEEFINIY